MTRTDMPIDRHSVPLLAVEDLGVEFRTRSGTVRALEDVGFELRRGETMALVGESGSGKSVTAYAVMGILDARGAGHLGDDRVRRARPARSRCRDPCRKSAAANWRSSSRARAPR